jgi:hypothetical protein
MSVEEIDPGIFDTLWPATDGSTGEPAPLMPAQANRSAPAPPTLTTTAAKVERLPGKHDVTISFVPRPTEMADARVMLRNARDLARKSLVDPWRRFYTKPETQVRRYLRGWTLAPGHIQHESNVMSKNVFRLLRHKMIRPRGTLPGSSSAARSFPPRHLLVGAHKEVHARLLRREHEPELRNTVCEMVREILANFDRRPKNDLPPPSFQLHMGVHWATIWPEHPAEEGLLPTHRLYAHLSWIDPAVLVPTEESGLVVDAT